MASSSDVDCGVCNSRHNTTTASIWCPECDEGLCQTCLTYHTASKATRSHIVISIDAFKQLPPTITNISQYCKEHDRKYQLYCLQHDSPCCLLCVSTNHNACTEMQAIEELLKTAKTSTKLESLEQSLCVIKTNLNTAIIDRQDNLANIKEQKENIQLEVKQLRKRMDSHFDILEENILKDLCKTESNITSEIETFIKTLKDEKQKMNDFNTQVLAMKQLATDLQTFLATEDLAKKLQKEIKYIESFEKEQNLKQVEVRFKVSADMEAKFDQLGSILLKYHDSFVNLKTVDKSGAQKLTSATPLLHNTFDSTILTFEKRINYLNCGANIYGCAVLQNGNVLLAGRQRIVVLRRDGTLDKEIDVSPHDPFDLTCINDDLFALTCWEKPDIHIVSMVKGQIQRTIQTNTTCDGITYGKGNLVCCARHRGISAFDLDRNHSAYLTRKAIAIRSYVTTFKNKIYHTSKDSVVCYTDNGEKIWVFKDRYVLTSPKGIAVDNNCNVYVRDISKGVLLISPDGKQARTILTKDDRVDDGYTLYFDRQRNTLFVVNWNSAILEFKIS